MASKTTPANNSASGERQSHDSFLESIGRGSEAVFNRFCNEYRRERYKQVDNQPAEYRQVFAFAMMSAPETDEFYEFVQQQPAAALDLLRLKWRSKMPALSSSPQVMALLQINRPDRYLHDYTEGLARFTTLLLDNPETFFADEAKSGAWKALLDAGLCALLEDMVDNKDFMLPIHTQPLSWTLDVFKIVDAVNTSYRHTSHSSSSTGSSPTLKQVSEIATKLFDNLSKTCHRLTACQCHSFRDPTFRHQLPGEAQALRAAIYVLYFKDATLYDTLLQGDTILRSFSVIFWMFRDDKDFSEELLLLSRIAVPPGRSFCHDVLWPMCGGEVKFMKRLNETVKEAGEAGSVALGQALSSVIPLLMHVEILPHVQSVGLLKTVHDAVVHSCEDGVKKQEPAMRRMETVSNALKLLTNTFRQGLHLPSQTTACSIAGLALQSGVFELGTLAIRIWLEQHSTGSDCKHETCDFPIVEFCDCLAITVMDTVKELKDFASLNSLRTELRREWHTTLAQLRTVRSQARWAANLKNVVSAWYALGARQGFDELLAFEDNVPHGEVPRYCAWKACRWSGEKPKVPLQACSRCGTVLYCSTTCQKKDWKEGGHKGRCQRPSGAAVVASTSA
ncbi:hypothetical protein PENSPDRAFT_647923 [Peniophora sp. CONT]|nr:hypothetical protein PENSPDRAFT_647923 [Peniophora sp. CONT]